MARQPKYRITLQGGPLHGRSYARFEVHINKEGYVAFSLPEYEGNIVYRQADAGNSVFIWVPYVPEETAEEE